MSTDGDASNRLSDALDELFAKAGRGADDANDRDGATPTERIEAVGGNGAPAATEVGPSIDESAEDDEPYALPEIVPATEDPEPTAATPTLPARPAPAPAPAPSPAPAAPAPAPVAPPAPVASAPAPVSRPATGWSDHMTSAPVPARGSTLRAPGRRPRVRRVTRVLRHIDPWSTFKVALLFSMVTYLVALTSGVLLWRVADRTGTLDNIERWFTQFGWETFELQGGEVFHNAWIIGLFGAVAMTGGLVLLATLFNLVSDIIGGVRLTVLEEEVVERTITSTRRYVVRQGAAGAPAATATQDWAIDDDTADSSAEVSSGQDSVTSPTPVAATFDDEPAEPTATWSID